MNRKLKSLFTLAALVFITTVADSASKKKLEFSEPEVVGVLFYADWCGKCKVLDPQLKKATGSFINQPILLTTFDMTNLSSQFQSGQLAKALNLSDLYQKIGVKTGFMVLVDAESGELIDRVNSADSPEIIASKIKAALTKAS